MNTTFGESIRGELTPESLRGSARRRRKELIIHRLFSGAAFLSMIVSALILLSLVGRAFDFLANIDLSSLVAPGWIPRQGMYDIRTIFVGTLLVTGVGMLVATPLGLGAASGRGPEAHLPQRRHAGRGHRPPTGRPPGGKP